MSIHQIELIDGKEEVVNLLVTCGRFESIDDKRLMMVMVDHPDGRTGFVIHDAQNDNWKGALCPIHWSIEDITKAATAILMMAADAGREVQVEITDQQQN